MSRKTVSGESLEFNKDVRPKVIERQGNRCAYCGHPLVERGNEAHHLFAVQSVQQLPPKLQDEWHIDWITGEKNCVILCRLSDTRPEFEGWKCHARAHQDNTRTGALAPPSYFAYSHAAADALEAPRSSSCDPPRKKNHKRWAKEAEGIWQQLFGALSGVASSGP